MKILKSKNNIKTLLGEFEKGKTSPEKFLAQLILMFKTENEMVDFLYGLLTKKEIKTLSSRVLVVKKLKDQVSQRDIVDKLKVGVATVSRGAKEIEKGRFKFL